MFIILLLLFSISAMAQSAKPFPPPDTILTDAANREPRSGVQLHGNKITITQGVGAPGTINVLSFSHDGKLLAAGKDFGRVVLWDVASRKFLRAFETGQGIVKAVALSPDGQTLATAGDKESYSLKLWKVRDGKLLKTFETSQAFIHSASFGPNGDWLMISDNTARTYVLDIASGKPLLDLKDMWDPVLAPDGKTFIVSGDKKFVLWNTTDWQQLGTIPEGEQQPLPLAMLPQADTFIAGLDEIHLYQLSTGQMLPASPSPLLPKFNLAEGGFAVFGAPHSTVFGDSGDRLWLWDTSTGQTCVSGVMYSASGALSPDGTLLAGAKANSIMSKTRSGDGVWLWDTAKLRATCDLAGHGGQ
jgi:WD40 repeat protein